MCMQINFCCFTIKPFLLIWGSLCKLPSSWPPAWGTLGSVPHWMLRFRWIRWIRWIRRRTPWGAEVPYFTILLALFSGIGDPFLALNLKKPKENHCFWLRTLKNLRKTFVFVFPRASGDPGGTIGPTTPKKYISQTPDPPPKRPLC